MSGVLYILLVTFYFICASLPTDLIGFRIYHKEGGREGGMRPFLQLLALYKIHACTVHKTSIPKYRSVLCLASKDGNTNS
jgi:hypothetical protein